MFLKILSFWAKYNPVKICWLIFGLCYVMNTIGCWTKTGLKTESYVLNKPVLQLVSYNNLLSVFIFEKTLPISKTQKRNIQKFSLKEIKFQIDSFKKRNKIDPYIAVFLLYALAIAILAGIGVFLLILSGMKGILAVFVILGSITLFLLIGLAIRSRKR